MEKHTPGPWKACKSHEDFDGPFFDIEPDEVEYYNKRPYTWIYAKDRAVVGAHDLFEMREADAKLIESAPELFEAAESLLIDAMDRGECFDEDTGEMFDDYKALYETVQKAKGEIT